MNPWMIAALIAGAIGVASLAKSAALAALPRVTSWALVYIPTPGVNGLWDLWITSLSGASGPAMLSAIPGGQMIYIPAALASKQPMNADWSYTFTPRGSSQPFTIVVPAAILQAYAATPKSALVAQAIASHAAMQGHLQNIQMVQPTAQAPTTAQDIANLISRVKAVIASAPPAGSDASTYGLWLATTALQVPGFIASVQTAISAIQNNTVVGDLATLQALLPTLLNLVAQVSQAAASAPSTTPSGGGGGGDFGANPGY